MNRPSHRLVNSATGDYTACVLRQTSSRLNHLIATLCVALTIFYAAMAPAKAADQIQHSPAFMAFHEHEAPGIFAIDVMHDNQADHADHHRDAPDDENGPGDHLAGGHHHHGDSGSSLLVPHGAAAAAIAPYSGLHAIGKDRQISGLRSIGPDRPPRDFPLTA